MSYWRLYYHIVWAVYRRQPWLDAETEAILLQVMRRKCHELDLTLHAAGSAWDHTHCLLSIPPKIPVCEVVRHIKGASSYEINRRFPERPVFRWQDGYGVFSVSERALPAVKHYVLRQKEHHLERRLWRRLEDVNAGEG